MNEFKPIEIEHRPFGNIDFEIDVSGENLAEVDHDLRVETLILRELDRYFRISKWFLQAVRHGHGFSGSHPDARRKNVVATDQRRRNRLYQSVQSLQVVNRGKRGRFAVSHFILKRDPRITGE